MTKRPPPQIVNGTLEYWAALRAARGHATVFARNSAGDKRVVEKATVLEWAKAVGVVEGLTVTAITEGPANAFPDFNATLTGESISIELTELLHSPDILKTSAKGHVGFDDLQWTEGQFRERVNERINAKAAKLCERDRRCAVLIVHTDEPWLSPAAVSGWLKNEAFPPQQTVEAAYLLMTYVPGWAKHWPVFRLWGTG